ncbi:MAG: cobalamin biosynthesis protein CobD [Magnetococcales bacterium]|nr:cobalamin biosynthesis protein CobD [Magnetococcales bacterium]
MDGLPLAFVMVFALIVDRYLGEIGHFHPLVGMGNVAHWLEGKLNVAYDDKKLYTTTRIFGIISLVIIVMPVFLLTLWLSRLETEGMMVQLLALYFVLGAKSLSEHGLNVSRAMGEEGVEAARKAVGRMVSRETQSMDEEAIACATIESVLENGCDAVFGALFWFVLLGAPGAVCYRVVNTLDAMWGYRTVRFNAFGWAAARMDDLLNYVPARLTALTYLIVGKSVPAMKAWHGCRVRKSPNATLVMAVGAGALALSLGGKAVYQGVERQNPMMGGGAAPEISDIPRAVALVDRGIVLWSVVVLMMGVLTFA